MSLLVPDVRLLRFQQLKFFNMIKKDLAFIRDRCCHLTFCLHMMEPHYLYALFDIDIYEATQMRIVHQRHSVNDQETGFLKLLFYLSYVTYQITVRKLFWPLRQVDQGASLFVLSTPIPMVVSHLYLKSSLL